jgi:hypothetical protein
LRHARINDLVAHSWLPREDGIVAVVGAGCGADFISMKPAFKNFATNGLKVEDADLICCIRQRPHWR